MNKRFLWIGILYLLVANPFGFAKGELWAVYQGSHFNLYLKKPDDQFSQNTLKEAEEDLDRILANLDDAKLKNKWQKEKRVKIFLFETQAAFQVAGGAPSWAAGHANYETRSIASFVGSDAFLSSTLPHEIAHLVLFDLTGDYQNVPRWLHEGFALSQESGQGERMNPVIKLAAHEGKMVPLKMLTIVNASTQTPGAANVYYAEAQAFVSFLIKNGRDRFRDFILNLSKGLTFEEAIERAYHGVFGDMSALEEKFYAALNAL